MFTNFRSIENRGVPTFIFVAGVVLSTLAFFAAKYTDDQRVSNLLAQQVDWRTRDIQAKINDAATPVEALADFVLSQHDLNEDEFRRFAINARRNNPVTRLAWAPLVRKGERTEFESSAQKNGVADYAISERDDDGNPRSAGIRDEYLPVRFFEQFDGASTGYGFDLLSETGRAAIVEEARGSGQPVAAAPYRAISRFNTIPNYVVFWPVYSDGAVPTTAVERRAAFAGVIIGVYPVDKLMSFALQEPYEQSATLNLFMDHPPGEVFGIPIAVTRPEGGKIIIPTAELDAQVPGSLRLMHSFALFGHDWTLVSDYGPEIVKQQQSSSRWAYLALGLFTTFGIVGYVTREQQQRRLVEAEVVERTRTLEDTAAALRATGEQLRAIIDASPLAIVATDPGRIVTTWNQAAEDIFGYSADEIIGQQLPTGVVGDPIEFERRRQKIVAGEILRSVEIPRVRKDGRKIDTVSSLAALFDSSGILKGTITTTEDVTSRNLTQRQLQQAQKMEAVGQLTGGLAHDFNNLLGVILGNLEELQETHVEGSEQAELADFAIRAVLRGAELTRQLLAFARQQPLAPKVVDVHATMGAIVQLLQRALGEQITLELKISDSLWPVIIDDTQLESAILNLAVNARDAMPGGGQLTVEASNITLDDGDAELNPEAAPGNYVAISVSDTGQGMPAEIVAKAFDPFFSTKGDKGTGLGLSMVHGFVKQSGGHTKIYSEAGRGTTIRLYLPRASEDKAKTKEAKSVAKQFNGNEVILVVEDNPGLRDVAMRLLHRFGYRTIPSENAIQALEIIRGGAPIDLLFTDVVMPGGMDGRGLAEAARRIRPDLKVLFTSGFTPAAASAASTGDFNFNLLTKPYRKEELGLRIRAALDNTGMKS